MPIYIFHLPTGKYLKKPGKPKSHFTSTAQAQFFIDSGMAAKRVRQMIPFFNGTSAPETFEIIENDEC